MNARHRTYYDLATRLAFMGDDALARLLDQAQPGHGWGRNRLITVGGHTVFTKAVPLTELERQRPYHTGNVFGLPTFYNYGVGSAGFGVFRELATHVKTTHWVLSGQCAAFPLMYHHRILPRSEATQTRPARDLDVYVAYWDGNAQIRRYMEARRAAHHEVVLFLEYIPHALKTWLGQNLGHLPMVMAGMAEVTTFLRSSGVIHFDAHLANILTNGEQIFLTDFGLALDDAFDLTAEERAFLNAHHHYDWGEFIAALAGPLSGAAEAWDDTTRDAVNGRYGDVDPPTLLRHLEDLSATGHLDLPQSYIDTLLRYRPVIQTMGAFFKGLREGEKAQGGYDDARLKRLFREIG